MTTITKLSKEEQNTEILKTRTALFNEKQGARVGDFIKLPTEQGDFYTRITHDWGDQLQTGGSAGNAYYLGNGYLGYSGGLDSGLLRSDLIPTEETKEGQIWFFSQDRAQAHNGVYFSIPFRVFIVKEDADLKGLYDYKKKLESIEKAKLPVITMINGNRQPYKLPLPEIALALEVNDVAMAHMEEETKLNFRVGAWGRKVAQPTTYEQLATFMVCENWTYKFYNNSTFENTIIITGINRD